MKQEGDTQNLDNGSHHGGCGCIHQFFVRGKPPQASIQPEKPEDQYTKNGVNRGKFDKGGQVFFGDGGILQVKPHPKGDEIAEVYRKDVIDDQCSGYQFPVLHIFLLICCWLFHFFHGIPLDSRCTFMHTGIGVFVNLVFYSCNLT
nr:hypothetical protein [Faecalibaculum rodentium]